MRDIIVLIVWRTKIYRKRTFHLNGSSLSFLKIGSRKCLVKKYQRSCLSTLYLLINTVKVRQLNGADEVNGRDWRERWPAILVAERGSKAHTVESTFDRSLCPTHIERCEHPNGGARKQTH